MVERQPAIDRQPVLVLRVLLVLRVPVRVLRVAQLLVPVLLPVLPLEAQWLALVAQPPVRPDLGSNPPQVPR
jgi:hypothetical protein